MKTTGWIKGLVVLGLLAACTDREIILPGKRESLRAVLSDGGAEAAAQTEASGNQSAPIRLGPQQANSSWTARPASPAYRTTHPALGGALQLAWSAPIGAGDSRKTRITADPVVANGRVFTLDAQAQVTATSTSGATLWSYDMTPERDNAGEGSGGGLALGGGQLYVTSGFGVVVALDPATGEEIWTQDLNASGSGTPSYHDGLVYLVAGDSIAWALEADTGRIRWQLDSAADLNNISGGPAPAVTDNMVVFGFGSGELQAAFQKGGLTMWNASLVGKRDGRAIANVGDITGDPMVVGDTIYASNFAGRIVALNAGNGERIWTAREAAIGPMWPIGGALFAVNDLDQLIRLDASDGSRLWAVDLPRYVKQKPRKRGRVYAHHGPVVAGGRVIVASDDGLIRQFNPESGALIGTVEIPGGATTNPVVAGRTLYVVSTNGQLLAFR